MANFPDGSIPVTFNASVVAAIQDKTLSRVFRDALYPRLLFRMEAPAEMWPANLGTNQTFTRPGLIPPSTRPLQPGASPQPTTYDFEQWSGTAQQWGLAIDTHMPTSYVSLASLYLRNIHQLGLNAGQSLNRVVRDKLYNAYTAGNTVADAAAIITATTIHVKNLTGFTRKLKDGQLQQVSASNPIAIKIGPAGAPTYTGNVTAFASDLPNDEIHGGTLTITPALTVAVVARDAVIADNGSHVFYSNGANRVDDVTGAAQFHLADVRASVAQLRYDLVPPHDDGTYHYHLDSISESQVFGDNEFQRLNQSIPDYIHYRRMAIAYLLGCTFYRNQEVPNPSSVSEDPATGFTTGFETTNPAGVQIHRPIVTGSGAVEEKYLDESRYISEAGIQGKIGEFAVTNNGVQVLNERIRLVMRAPQDRLQQETSTAWSFSGDWPIPTDALGKSSKAAYKRAVVTVHGS